MPSFFGYRLITDFKPTGKDGAPGNGRFAIGEKSGTKFFIKQNTEYVFKDSSFKLLDREKANELYRDYLNLRRKIQQKMNEAGIASGDTVVREEEILEYGDPSLPGRKSPVVITRLIDNVIHDPLKIVSKRISLEQKKQIWTHALENLTRIHQIGLIHGDLKPGNIMLGNRGGGIQTYLVDFDASYFENQIPERAVQSPFYETPEVHLFHNQGARDDSNKSFVTTKTDIFSLGIIFYELFTGDLPIARDTKTGGIQRVMAIAVNEKSPIIYDSSLNKPLSPGHPKTFKNVIESMLTFDPTKRPSAKDLLNMVKGISPTIVLPAGTVKPTITPSPASSTTHPIRKVNVGEMYPNHREWISFKSETELMRMNVTSIQKNSSTDQQRYEVKLGDGKTFLNYFTQLALFGYATILKLPFPDSLKHLGLTKEKLLKKNIYTIESTSNPKTFLVKLATNLSKQMTENELVEFVLGFMPKPTVHPSPSPISLIGDIIKCKPYPEDRIVFESERVFKDKNIRLIRTLPSIPKLYILTYESGTQRQVNASTLRLMGLAKST
jgi:serine/threonine protein kinase